ncbi:hypothetical protein Gbem_2848 [Citrifermentans bemidjiense Bem]|uniref:Uncharacterized protein n=1 Tax=Citrifermentans bemidjiense (strain ATCC BAA-1014 / DSM 16622 / JCM 12645 / Bem) TaxID=404380 RepID=B5EIF0_CITBB|nr:hypothetical protein [Citrifermentans bemidjiense]ACH39852.1 hypothetical protein Gbem_2848 [Citrifermentans bemidjiense Bem]
MEKAPFILVLFVSIIGLLAANPGFRDIAEHDKCEISSYDYAKLHAAMEHDAEIAALARRELTQDHVTIAQYNRVMRKIDSIKLKQAHQVAAVQQASLR